MTGSVIVVAASLLLNAGFDRLDSKGNPANWAMPAKNWRVVWGAGMNGNPGLVCEGTDLTHRNMPRQKVSLKKGRRYRISGWIKTEDLKCDPKRDGAHPGAMIHLECLDSKGRFVGGRSTKRVSGTTDWMKVSVVTYPIVADAAVCNICPVVNGCPSGKAVFDDLHIEEVTEALMTAVATSAYRNEAHGGKVTFFGGLDLVGNNVDPKSATFKVSYVSGDGSRREKIGRVISGYEAAAEIDVCDMAIGTNIVVCTVEGGGKSVSLERSFVRSAAPLKRRTYIDRDGTLIDGGKPFFPVTIFTRFFQDIDDISKGGFNSILPINGCTNNAALDLCAKKNLRVIYSLFQYIRKEPADFEGLRDVVRRFKDHPAILAWYINDELPKSRVGDLRRAQRIVEEEDPHHPTYSAMHVPTDARDYLGTCDVYGFDPYPVTEKKVCETIAVVTKSIRDGRAGTFGAYPIWQIPQAFAWEGQRLPTREEMRQMTMQSIAAGAKGVVFFRYMHTQERTEYNRRKDVKPLDFALNHAELEDIAKEVRACSKTFLSPVCDVKVEGNTGDLVWRAWKDKETGLVRMLFVNNAPASRQVLKLRVTPPGERTRSLRLDLPPLGCRWYTLDPDRPAGEINPGRLWRDTAGHVINAHGAGLLADDGMYWWYGEHKVYGKSGNKAHVGVHAYSSLNLTDWTDRGIVFAVSDDPESEVADGCIIERPKVIRCAKTGKYVMYFHLEHKGTGYKTAKAGVAVADAPSGPFRFVRADRPNGAQSRDMTLFVDSDGTAYHVYSSENNETLHIDRLTDDYLGYSGESIRILEKTFTEAPALFKRDGWYWLLGSGCSGWSPNAARIFRSRKLAGPWENMGNPCQGTPSGSGIGPDLTWGCQSTFVFQNPYNPGEIFAMFDRWKPENHTDSRYVWLPMSFETGRPVIRWVDRWIPGVPPAEGAVPVAAKPWLRAGETLACFGDSITELPGYFNIISNRLSRYNVKAVNVGRGGDNSATALMRISEVVEKKPDAVLIFFGTNDSAAGRGRWVGEPSIEPETYLDNVLWMVHHLKRNGVKKFSFAATAGRIEGQGFHEFGNRRDLYNRMTRLAAERTDAVFIPLDTVFDGARRNRLEDADGRIFTADDVHLTAEGSRLAAETMLKAWGMDDRQSHSAKTVKGK